MVKLLKWLFCYEQPPLPPPKPKIEYNMINSNVIRVNMSSLRKWLMSDEGKKKSGSDK